MSDLFNQPSNFDVDMYRAKRELLFADNAADIYFNTKYDMTREQFESLSPVDQLKVMGVKSAPKRSVVTEAEDKAKKASKFKEENIVNAWAKWFKLTYHNIPYTIDKVAQTRSKLGGMIHKAASYQRGNPDIFIQSSKAGFSGLYIEQKTSDDIFYSGTKILKPGSDNRMVWQSLYHADLREQGYWVMFSISLEASQKIASRYMEGNPYKMVVFDYYCKPEDYPMFDSNKNFKPVDKP